MPSNNVPATTSLTPKQRRFVEEYLVDLNATQAATRAGYSAKTANEQGARLLANVSIATAIKTALDRRATRVGIDQDYVLKRLHENVERSMQVDPVLDREGKPTGAYIYQGNVANRALELLGKHLGMFTDKIDLSISKLSDLSDAELEALAKKAGLP